MKNLFIFGAGASHKAGGPLMSDFIDRADELYRQGVKGVMDESSSFEDVFNSISQLQSIYAKSNLNLDNIEVLFGAVEMGQLLERFGDRSPKEIDTLRKSLINVIVKTLETSIKFIVRNSHIYPPEPYGDFADIIINSLKSRGSMDNQNYFSFITFNYDLALDYALHHCSFPYDYCLDDKGKKQGYYSFLKLHGSINWGICEECNKIIPRHIGEANFTLWSDTKYVYYDLGSKLYAKKHHNKPLQGPPVLVPPTWNKSGYHNQLTNVWKTAALELSEAENIFIIGYSLPETDSFFRYLYALGSNSSTRLKRFWVFNPNNDGTVELRFKSIIGRGIENRFRYFPIKFEDAIDEIDKIMKEP